MVAGLYAFAPGGSFTHPPARGAWPQAIPFLAPNYHTHECSGTPHPQYITWICVHIMYGILHINCDIREQRERVTIKIALGR